MPIKIKFLLITALLLTLSSATIFWINRSSFIQDKKSYLYSSAMEIMQASAQEASFGTEKVLERVQTAILFFDPLQYSFSSQIKEIAAQQNWGDIQVYRMVGDENQFLDSLTESNAAQPSQLKYLRSLPEEQLTTDLDINKPDVLLIYYRKKDLLIYGALRFDGLKFANAKGSVGIYSPTKNDWHLPEGFQKSDSLTGRLAAQLKEKNSGVKEFEWDTKEYLISYTYITQINSFLFQTFEKGKIFAVLKQSLNKTLVASIIILIIGLVATIFAADSITKNISLLASEMAQFTRKGKSEGISLVSNDEVGKMAVIYNSMLAKIQSLLEETAAKARMESELSTAKEVQGYLLPKNKLDTEKFVLKGFYKPASECSGDLWFHHLDGENLFLFIGDATGHGVPAALITAAARSALSVAMSENIKDPARILHLMNQVLCDVARGSKMMTAFACLYNTSTHVLTYSNASHDFPLLIPPLAEGKKIKKNDLNFLAESRAKRLGDDPNAVYANTQENLPPGSIIFAYTDGLIDAINIEGTSFGERTMMKIAIDSINRGAARSLLDIYQTQITKFTEDKEQPDDITFLGLYVKSE